MANNECTKQTVVIKTKKETHTTKTVDVTQHTRDESILGGVSVANVNVVPRSSLLKNPGL